MKENLYRTKIISTDGWELKSIRSSSSIISEYHGAVRTPYGYVFVTSAKTEEYEFSRFGFIHEGYYYQMSRHLSYTHRGLSTIAARFARKVIQGQYD